MKERAGEQYRHLQKLDEACQTLKFLGRINPSSIAMEKMNKKAFHHYYGATRDISKPNGELVIKIDHEMVLSLRPQGVTSLVKR